MARLGYLRWALLALIVCAQLAVCCGCSGQAVRPSAAEPRIELSTADGSSWQAGDLAARLEPAPGGWALSIACVSKQPACKVLLEVHFAPAFSAVDAKSLLPDGKLSLLVADKPGVLALGVIMPEGQTIAPGELLRARLVRNSGAVRSASQAPTGAAGRVLDLAGDDDGSGGAALTWGYFSTGDYNQDNQVSITDLTPLGIHFGEQSPKFPKPFPAETVGAVVDGNGDGQIAIADITPIGINYGNRVDGYHVYRADGPDAQTAHLTQLVDAAFGGSALPASSRRQFSATLQAADVTIGGYYLVKPYEQASGQVGPASNVLQYYPSAMLKFHVPPAGNAIVDSTQAQNPSLVLMPAIPGVSQSGAPVIVYTTLGGGSATPLMLGYYGTGGWMTEEIGAGGNFSTPKALWLAAAGGDPAQGMVVAYDLGGQTVVDQRFDEHWAPTGSQNVGSDTGTFSNLAFDRDPLGGGFGVAHARSSLAGGSVVYSHADPGGAWSTEPVYSGDSIGGVTFRFDPSGGDPWLLFTHGTTSTSGTIQLDYTLEQARRSGGAWNVTAVPYPDSPLQVDLGFRADGTPQLACTAARDYTVNIPGVDPVTISLLYDALTGEYNGSAWHFQKVFESTFGISLGFPPTTLILDLNLASDVGWAKPDELLYSHFTGSIEVDITTYLPKDGALANDSQYMLRQGSGYYGESGYYGGDPGRAFSWALNADGDPVCAYIRSTSLSAADVLSGNFSAAGELAFWQP